MNTEAGGQKTGAGGRKTEVGGQGTEVGGRKTEVGGQGTEAGGQRSSEAPTSGVRPPTTGVRPPTSGVRPPTSGVQPPASGVRPQASGVRPPASGSADLHLHTNFSDGTYSPEELVAQAAKQRLAAIALTDHDTVEGCERAGLACRAAGIEFIPGTELTAEQDGNEIHILGYFLDTRDPELLAEVARFQAVRQKRIHEMVARLRELNVPLEADAVFALANCRSPGRPHVARALVKAGLCDSLDEAFERFLKKNRPAWVPKMKISALVAIELIHRAGGLAVMAHPGLNRSDGVIPMLVEAGLDGIECYHTKHPPATVEHYRQIADRFRLLVTGGSDCHGLSKGKPLIGTVRLPYEYVTLLKSRVESRGPRAGNPNS